MNILYLAVILLSQTSQLVCIRLGKHQFHYIRDNDCRDQVKRLVEGIGNEPWAIKTSSMRPYGILHGNDYQFGDYDRCLGIQSPDGVIKGQYCLLDIQIMVSPEISNDFNLDYNPYAPFIEKLKTSRDPSKKNRNIIHNGICVPKVCSRENVEMGLNLFLQEIGAEYGYNISVVLREKSCSTADTQTYGMGGKIVWGILIILFKVVLLSTLWDTLKKDSKNDRFEMVTRSFSVKRNLIDLTSPSKNEELDAFHGMKTMSMMLIILGHRCLASLGGPVFNADFLEQGYRYFPTILLLNGILIVDTFFFIGGFLNFVIIDKELKTGRKISVLHVCLHRWLRITPGYIFMVFFYGYVLESLGNGPAWSLKVGREAERCRQNWWTNLFYINNYVNPKEMCMFQSWYIACDMHYTILSPAIVKLVSKMGKRGFLLLTTSIVASSLCISAVTFFNKYDGTMRIYYRTFQDLASNEFFTQMYVKTPNRIIPYLSGMTGAYIYLNFKNSDMKPSKFILWMTSVTALIFGLASICVAWIFYLPERGYDPVENAIYASTHRIFWSLSIGWISLACAKKYYGIIQPILTAKIFIPFSKLSFGVFLVHGAVQICTIASLRSSEYISYPKLFWMASGDILLSYFFALLLHLLVEAPMKRIHLVLFYTQVKK